MTSSASAIRLQIAFQPPLPSSASQSQKWSFWKTLTLETTWASNISIYHNVSLESRYISTRNDVTGYLRSAVNRINMFILGHVHVAIFDKGLVDFKQVHNFGKSDFFASLSIVVTPNMTSLPTSDLQQIESEVDAIVFSKYVCVTMRWEENVLDVLKNTFRPFLFLQNKNRFSEISYIDLINNKCNIMNFKKMWNWVLKLMLVLLLHISFHSVTWLMIPRGWVSHIKILATFIFPTF